MSLQFSLVLSAAYQKESDLIKAAALLAGVAEPRTNFTKKKYIYPDAGAAGVIYGTRNPAAAGYAMRLIATDEEELKESMNNVYSENTTDFYLKSTVNGDVVFVELHD
jgi:hypothetical protein